MGSEVPITKSSSFEGQESRFRRERLGLFHFQTDVDNASRDSSGLHTWCRVVAVSLLCPNRLNRRIVMSLQPGEYAVTPSTRPRPCPGADARGVPFRSQCSTRSRTVPRAGRWTVIPPADAQVPESSRPFDRRLPHEASRIDLRRSHGVDLAKTPEIHRQRAESAGGAGRAGRCL